MVHAQRMRYYGEQNKAGGLLATTLKPRAAKAKIEAIRDEHQGLLTKSTDIAKAFCYSSEVVGKAAAFQELARYLPHPSLSVQQAQELDKQISVGELQAVLKDLNTGKAAGPDGIPIKFYQTFETDLAPHLLMYFQLLHAQAPSLGSFNEATIIVLEKAGRDLHRVENYRTISLLNADYKLFSSILAHRGMFTKLR